MSMSSTKKLVIAAVMVAIATALSFIKFNALWVNGGSFTLASMLPIVLISFILGWRWGLLSGLVFGLINMITGGLYAPPTVNFINYLAEIMLDYLLAFAVIGLAEIFGKPFRNQSLKVLSGTVAALFLRFVMHFLSGILVWQALAPEGQPAWIYSIVYNGSYMLPEIVLTAVLAVLIMKLPFVKKLMG